MSPVDGHSLDIRIILARVFVRFSRFFSIFVVHFSVTWAEFSNENDKNWTKLCRTVCPRSFLILHQTQFTFFARVFEFLHVISANFKYFECKRCGRVRTCLIGKQIEQKLVSLTCERLKNEWMNFLYFPRLYDFTIFPRHLRLFCSLLSKSLYSRYVCVLHLIYERERFVERELTQGS